MSERNVKIADSLKAYAEERGYTLLELAFSWLAAQEPVCSVIAGATRPEQIEQNVAAVRWNLTLEERSQIDELASPEV